MKKDNKIIFAIIVGFFLLDQITKIIAVKNGYMIENTNTGNNGYHILISIIIIGMIFKYIFNDNIFIKLDTKIILSIAIAGAIGNLLDRIWNKNVIVFINLGKNIELNLAYFYIIVAWIGMAIILTKNTMRILKSGKNINITLKGKKDENNNK